MKYMNCFFKLIQRKKKIILYIIYFIVLTITIITSYKTHFSIPADELNYMKETMPEFGLEFFYSIHDPGLFISSFIVIVAMIPNVISIDFLGFKRNRYKDFLMTRISYEKYQKSLRRFNFIFSFLFMLITQIMILVIIHLFCYEISFRVDEFYFLSKELVFFSDSVILSLVIYILMISLGYAVFSHFLYSLQFLIRNPYVYCASGIFISLLSIIGSAVVTMVAYNTCGSLLATFSYFFCMNNLLNPIVIMTTAFVESGYPILYYIGSIIVYYLMALCLFEIGERRGYKSDE